MLICQPRQRIVVFQVDLLLHFPFQLIQTVAEMLQVPVNMIRVKPSNTFVGANGMLTAGSLGSEIVCYVSFQFIFIRSKVALNGNNDYACPIMKTQ